MRVWILKDTFHDNKFFIRLKSDYNRNRITLIQNKNSQN